ncbi:MAG: 50S ribosomal protein L32 [Deltaproteobacteria bacterium]|nr:50S ribosomal protein L32 [Deltaproteobacteria bacterium]
MPVPKKRTSKSKRNSRRAHHRLGLSHALTCKKCGEFVLPHRVCLRCGFYKGESVF